jgi:branched-chain amino acid transport system substrate-binding protein
MLRRDVLKGFAAAGAASAVGLREAAAQDVIKIGACLSLVGGFQTVGRQALAGAKLYMQLNGDKVAGKKIELIVREDSGVPDVARRVVQEMIVNEKVNIVLGGITPTALALTQLVTQAKIPTVVIISGASITVDRSPFMVRTSFTLGQSSMIMAEWAAKNGSKRVVTLVNDWAPGTESEAAFSNAFTAGGGQVIEKLKVPLANPDFAPFLQRARDASPEGLFVFVPAGQGAALMKQFVERGMDKSGIRLIGTGDMTDDDILNGFGDAALGVVTSHHYSAAHPSALNKAFVEAFAKAIPGTRPNFMGVAGYDGMALIYAALEKTKGNTDGDALIGAMKGASWESPRGPISIDADTRDIVQTIYVRKVEKKNGELWNIEFDKIDAVKDPAKAAKK